MAPPKTLNKVEMEWRRRKAELLRKAVEGAASLKILTPEVAEILAKEAEKALVFQDLFLYRQNAQGHYPSIRDDWF